MTSELLPCDWLSQPLSHIAALAPITPLHEAFPNIWVKREDLLSTTLGGNKIYKLYHHLHRARAAGKTQLVSFGGAYSNHLYALAAAGNSLGFATRGIVRGEQAEELSSTLTACKAMGMALTFISRRQYRHKNDYKIRSELGLYQPDIYVIPEGGSGLRGALGMAEYGKALATLHQEFAHVVMACGTGASVAGLLAGLPRQTQVHGICVLKGSAKMLARYQHQLLKMATALAPFAGGQGRAQWRFHSDFHGGGYGPMHQDMVSQLWHLLPGLSIPLDQVYTGKMVLATLALLERGVINPNQKVLLVHSGGLQGGVVQPCDALNISNHSVNGYNTSICEK